MIRRIVLDEKHPVAFPIKGWQDLLAHKGLVSGGVKVIGLMPIDQLTVGQGDGPQNLLGIAFPPSGNLGLGVKRCPGLVQRGALPEGSLIDINDHRSFGLGFFLRLG